MNSRNFFIITVILLHPLQNHGMKRVAENSITNPSPKKKVCRALLEDSLSLETKTNITCSIPNKKITYSLSMHQNTKPSQEDRFVHKKVNNGEFFAIYDGHHGDRMSSFLKNNLHDYFAQCLTSHKNIKQAFEAAFAKAEKYALNGYAHDGSTAVVAYIDCNKILHLAWAGDSRAVLEKDGGVICATPDHKPDRRDEKERIENAGGKIVHKGVYRIQELAVSRSVGDKEKKLKGKNQIIAIPEYMWRPLTDDNNFLILASDGIWDKVTNYEAVSMTYKALQKGKSLDEIAQALQDIAIHRGSGDNITVCVVKFS